MLFNSRRIIKGYKTIAICIVTLLVFYIFLSTIVTEVGNEVKVYIPELKAIDGETLHVATVIGGLQYTFSLSVLLKSLLLHRSNPLMLHLMVDNEKIYLTYQKFIANQHVLAVTNNNKKLFLIAGK